MYPLVAESSARARLGFATWRSLQVLGLLRHQPLLSFQRCKRGPRQPAAEKATGTVLPFAKAS